MEYFCRWNQYHSQYDCDRVDSKHAVLFPGRDCKRRRHRFLHLIIKQSDNSRRADKSCGDIHSTISSITNLDCPKWYGYD